MSLLGSIQPTAPVTKQVIGTQQNLAGKKHVNLVTHFAYGSGGLSTKVHWQTKIGNHWHDIACHSFSTITQSKYNSCDAGAGVSSAITLTDGALADDTAINGLFFRSLRAIVTTTGTYEATTVTCEYEVHS